MSLYDRRTLILSLAALPLAGCGYAPAHAPGGRAAGLHGSVGAEAPTDRQGYDLVERLEQRLGRAAAPRWLLAYRIETMPVGAGITRTGAITRYTLTGNATYRLTESATGAEVTAGRVEGFTSWSAAGSTVATLAAEQDAHRRLMHILADQIVTRLTAAGME
ncbi:MAG: LPS assembly lipoprotein LptE [Gemmobacter sp.]